MSVIEAKTFSLPMTKSLRVSHGAFLRLYSSILTSIKDLLTLHRYLEATPPQLSDIIGLAKNPCIAYLDENSNGYELLSKTSVIQLEDLALNLNNKCFSVASTFEATTQQVQNGVEKACYKESKVLELVTLYEDFNNDSAFDRLIAAGEELLRYILSELLESRSQELIHLDADLEAIARNRNASYVHLEYADSLDYLSNKKPQPSIKTALTLEEYQYLTHAFGNRPIVLKHLPDSLVPFYGLRTTAKEESYSFMLLYPKIGPVLIGMLYEPNISTLYSRLKDNLDNPKALKIMEPYLFNRQAFQEVRRGGFCFFYDKFINFITQSNCRNSTKSNLREYNFKNTRQH